MTFNGLEKNVIVITSSEIKPQIYYPFKNKVEVDITPYDFENVKILIDKFNKRSSIIIDSRLEYIAITTHLNYPDYPLIYDANTESVLDIYQFLSGRSMFNIQGMYVYTKNAAKLIDMYVFIKFMCSDLGIHWNCYKAIEVASRNDNFVDMILNYIDIHEFDPGDMTNEHIRKIKTAVDEKFSRKEKICDTIDELYSALMTMRSIGMKLKMYI